MSRHARGEFETEFLHVIVQGIAREKIFYNAHYKNMYLQKLAECKKEYSVSVLAYCILDNHCHLLLQAENIEDLSHYMQKVNTMYAQYYNFKESRVGYVFRDRFKSQPVYHEKYLGRCLAYIHNNPVKAGVCVRAEQYGFSSLYEFVEQKENLVDFEEAKQFFDISPENMLAIMDDYDESDDDTDWIDIKSEMQTVAQKAEKILAKFAVPPQYLVSTPKLFEEAVKEMSKAGIKGVDIASIMGCSTSKISRLLKEK